MPHDKIKSAARRRMSVTGEPYAAARRQAISKHSEGECTSPVSAQDIRAAAGAHFELGPEYSDAVVAAFIDRVDTAVAARVEARLADLTQSRAAKPARRARRLLTRRVARDVLAASAGALIAVGAVGVFGIASQHADPAVRVAGGPCARAVERTPLPMAVCSANPGVEVHMYRIGPGRHQMVIVSVKPLRPLRP